MLLAEWTWQANFSRSGNKLEFENAFSVKQNVILEKDMSKS